MATINPVIELMGDRGLRATWPNMANGDVGAPVNWTNFMDRSIQVEGVFGTGGSVAVEGSNNGTNFRSVSDMRGNALAINTARIEQLEDCVFLLRPNVTAGDGTTLLNVTLFARKVL
jgi:hypothetical protein